VSKRKLTELVKSASARGQAFPRTSAIGAGIGVDVNAGGRWMERPHVGTILGQNVVVFRELGVSKFFDFGLRDVTFPFWVA
jgi:hypothetical protein